MPSMSSSVCFQEGPLALRQTHSDTSCIKKAQLNLICVLRSNLVEREAINAKRTEVLFSRICVKSQTGRETDVKVSVEKKKGGC